MFSDDETKVVPDPAQYRGSRAEVRASERAARREARLAAIQRRMRAMHARHILANPPVILEGQEAPTLDALVQDMMDAHEERVVEALEDESKVKGLSPEERELYRAQKIIEDEMDKEEERRLHPRGYRSEYPNGYTVTYTSKGRPRLVGLPGTDDAEAQD